MFRKTEYRGLASLEDTDWAGAKEDRRSSTMYCTKVCDNLVKWRSKKQSEVAHSSAEAEFRALVQGVCKLPLAKKVDDQSKNSLF